MKTATPKKAAKRQAYHHGDLRRALLDAAREEIAANGAQSLSLSSLARRAGVAQSAPYRHFADRDELLAAVATEGFEAFTAALRAAAENGPEATALRRMCGAYLQFSDANVELYRLMFASGLVPAAGAGSRLVEAAQLSFQPLLERVGGGSASKRSRLAAHALWAQLHGIAMLKADGFVIEPSEQLLGAMDV